MATAFPPPAPTCLPVLDGAAFPVRRVYCVGRNYADHAREMGSDPVRDAPFFFAKPADAVFCGNPVMPYPPATKELHHEVELVVALGAGGADLDEAQAEACLFGYAVGLDMTRRDLQSAAKAKGQPWEMGKAFDFSAPCGVITPVSRSGILTSGAIALRVNGALRQSGDVSAMIWNVAELIVRLSRYVRLAPGDLVFTGTPAGVGAVEPGDRLDASIDGLLPLAITVGALPG